LFGKSQDIITKRRYAMSYRITINVEEGSSAMTVDLHDNDGFESPYSSTAADVADVEEHARG
jgi:hypothetical protein